MGKRYRPPIESLSPDSKAALRAQRRVEQKAYRATVKGRGAAQRGNAARVRVGGGVRAYVRSTGQGPRARYTAAQAAGRSLQLAKRSAACKALPHVAPGPGPAPAPPAPATPQAPARAPLRDISNQPMITSYLAAGAQYKPRAVQQPLTRYFKLG